MNNKKKFPWDKLGFIFSVSIIVGLIGPPILLGISSLPWYVWIIFMPLAILVYMITEVTVRSLMEDLEHFLGGCLACIACCVVSVSGIVLGGLIGYLLFGTS